MDSAEALDHVRSAAEALRVRTDGVEATQLCAAVAAAAARLAWLAAVPPADRATVAAAAAAAAGAPGAFPLGVELEDETLTQPSTLLRACHVAKLRSLQSRIDAALVAVQELTADPRTDTRRGRVGR